MLTVALGAVGCQDQLTEPTVESTSPAATAAGTMNSTASVANGLQRHALPEMPGRITDQQLVEAVGRAINPNDYVCPATLTPIIQYYVDAANAIEPEIFDPLYNFFLADLIPGIEAQFLLTEDTPQSFGYDGEFTRHMIKIERQVKGFWDVPSDNILLLAMKGTMLQDVDRVAATYNFFFGLQPATAYAYAQAVKDLVNASAVLDGGDHPLFSFNAFAYNGFAPLGIAPRIVMGDGILEGYKDLGFEDVAPQAVYSHEFAHHIQFRNDYFSDFYATTGDEAEQTRYSELMADAMAAYYLTHKRGATLNWKRVQQFLEIFYQIGDCAFSNPGHHGTPNQRMAAAQWGYELANEMKVQGHILTADEVHDLFVAEYPTFIAPDNI
jgi:hypothetical protein